VRTGSCSKSETTNSSCWSFVSAIAAACIDVDEDRGDRGPRGAIDMSDEQPELHDAGMSAPITIRGVPSATGDELAAGAVRTDRSFLGCQS